MQKLVFIGDSLTQWYGWQRRFPEHLVTNLGISGERVEALLDRVPEVQTEIKSVDIIFIMTGINNVAEGHYDFIITYREIVSSFAARYQHAKVVVQSILPTALEWIDNATIQTLNGQLEQVAQDLGALYLDIYRLYVDAKGNAHTDLYLDDGAHLSGKGYEVWANEVERFLLAHT
jgi:lysophospholipase L1-like esterase